LHVIKPPVVPFHANRVAAAVNRKAIERILLPKLGEVQSEVLWTFSPLTYGLAEQFGHTVYHSVDLLHTFPGVNSTLLLSRERELLKIADVVIASSIGVRDHLNAQGRQDVLLWENVAQTTLFAENMSRQRKSRAIFAGNLTPSKLDFALIAKALESGIPIALAGPMSIDGKNSTHVLRGILKHPLCSYLGNLSPAQLAREIGASKVGIIPYLANEYTTGVFPMKVYEYLAGGLSVVTTPLSSLTERSAIPGMTVASNHEEFVDVLTHELATFDLDSAAARSQNSLQFSWDGRIGECLNLLSTFR
jgi:hypothetical protein